MKYSEARSENIINAVNNNERVSGFTHSFYNYPARFSPIMAKEFIETFTRPGDFVLDPFMGGGTTLVESKVLNRNALGLESSYK